MTTKSISKSASSGRTSVDWPLFIDGATNFTIDNVIVDGGNSGGILNYGGSNGKIINNTVRNTLADAIHNTRGAHDIIVANNTVRNAGDDFIAVVGYAGDGQPYNILIQDNDVADQNWGGGISVLGGKNVTIQGNKVARTNHAAGIIVATEREWDTYSADNVLVRNNTLNDNSGATEHGAIFVYTSQGATTRVKIENNTITNSRHEGIEVFGAGSKNIALINNKINNPAEIGIRRTNNPVNVYCAGNLLNGAAYSPSCTGSNNFTVTGSPLTYVPTSPCP